MKKLIVAGIAGLTLMGCADLRYPYTDSEIANLEGGVVIYPEGSVENVDPPTRLDIEMVGNVDEFWGRCYDMGGTLVYYPEATWEYKAGFHYCEGVDY